MTPRDLLDILAGVILLAVLWLDVILWGIIFEVPL